MTTRLTTPQEAGMHKERGYGRLAIGLTLLLGVAGSADQTPLTWTMLPLAGLSLLIGLWGASRAKHGPTLRLLAGLRRAVGCLAGEARPDAAPAGRTAGPATEVQPPTLCRSPPRPDGRAGTPVSRIPVSTTRADDLMVRYARAHRLPITQTDELARTEGLITPEGRLFYAGARWFLLAPEANSRAFRLQLLTRGQRTVRVSSRAKLAVNLCELGYSVPQAGRHAYRAWGQGQSCNTTGRVIAQEVL